MLTISLLVSLRSKHGRFRAVWEQRTRNERQRPRKKMGRAKERGIVPFFARPNPKIPFLVVSALFRNHTEALAAQAILWVPIPYVKLVAMVLYFYKPKAIYQIVCQIKLPFFARSYYSVRRVTCF